MTDSSGDRPGSRRGLISRTESFLERVRNLVVSIAVILGFVVILASLIINGWSGRYSIEPITAPDDFQKEVENSAGIAALLRDDLNKLVQISGTNVAIKPVGDQKAPEVTVMGTTISIDYVIGAFRRLIGKEYPKITGEISHSAKHSTLADAPMLCPKLAKSSEPVKLILRVGDGGGVPFFEGEGSFPEVAMCGALYTLRIVDPYSAASYLGQTLPTRMQAFKLLDEVAADSPSADMAELNLIRGNIELGAGKQSDAERLFKQASSDYNDRHRGRINLWGWYPAFDGLTTNTFDEDGWYPALDGLATTYLLSGRYEQALDSVEKSLRLRQDYQSAMFHRAQIFDFQVRALTNGKEKDNCKILGYAATAREYYHNVLRRYPDMAVAYLNEGIMFLALDTYWRFHPSVQCNHGDDGYSSEAGAVAERLADLDEEAESDLKEATMLDPNDSNGWMQLGILLMQRQNPGIPRRPKDFTAEFRSKTLADALEALKTANKLNPDDPYISGLLDQAKDVEKQLSEAPE
jgi:tetratricopeptide (TPR) repeat protein